MTIRLAAAGVFATPANLQPQVVLARAAVTATPAAPPPPAAPAVRLAGVWLTSVTTPTATPSIRLAGATVTGDIAVILPAVREVWNGTAWVDITSEVYRGGVWRPVVIERWDGTTWITGPKTSNPPVQPPRKPIWYGLWHGDVDPSVGVSVKDTEMAQSINVPTPVATFRRGYSGNSHPATFAASSVRSALDYAAAQPSGKFGAMLNVKLPWAELANGNHDALIAGFYNSWPTNIYGVVAINHEPENDGPTPANLTNPTYASWAQTNGPIFRAGVKRYIDVAAPIIRSRGLDLKVGGCLMDFSWDVVQGTQRIIHWRWWEGLTQANLGQVDFGIDAYVKTDVVNGQPVGHSLTPRVREMLAECRAAGIGSFSMYETAVDRRLRNGGNTLVGTDQSTANWIPGYRDLLESIPEMRMVCWFHTPSGPASQYGFLAGPATPAWANVCMNGRRP